MADKLATDLDEDHPNSLLTCDQGERPIVFLIQGKEREK